MGSLPLCSPDNHAFFWRSGCTLSSVHDNIKTFQQELFNSLFYYDPPVLSLQLHRVRSIVMVLRSLAQDIV
jgi:hypothetical protein